MLDSRDTMHDMKRDEQKPRPLTIVRGGCGWLAVYDDGHIRCTNPQKPCPGPHTVTIEEKR
jgi:hypothetical protein